MESYRLCEAKAGYVWKIIVYTGKETELKDFVQGIDTKSLTKPTQIVLTLAGEILNKEHLIAMDNYYSSPELYDLLCQLKKDAIGTVRVNRKQFPKSVTQKKLQRGETVSAFKEKLMCLKWHDKKDITMMSTIHSNDMIEMQTKRGDVKHNSLVIIDYNTYTIARKRLKKYYHKMFRHLVDVTMFNAFILHKKQGGKLCHLNFRLSVIASIFEKYGNATISLDMLIRRISNPDSSTRLSGRHFLDYFPPSQKRKHNVKQCVVCSAKKVRKEVVYFCELSSSFMPSAMFQNLSYLIKLQ
ncbi:hypothetical protein ILUMI_20465 [Ignelater luminosus]|uniref:PiggyBac transposable element-derived protein domain-containing protein n=1 Tax=Ignelater luminosus TaxID=2038154 RepID=A0A8K0CI41_IGNLU|nr:hypothetical protein ILUMI_20465 [Ignelater luminosus]